MASLIEFLAQEWLLAAALAVVVAMLFLHESRKSGPSLSPQQAINLVNAEQGVFLDLRDLAEYRAGHIADAIHIPAGKLQGSTGLLDNYRKRPIVLVCKVGQSASTAGKQLKADGFEQVYKMSGGMLEWNNLQLPVVSNG